MSEEPTVKEIVALYVAERGTGLTHGEAVRAVSETTGVPWPSIAEAILYARPAAPNTLARQRQDERLREKVDEMAAPIPQSELQEAQDRRIAEENQRRFNILMDKIRRGREGNPEGDSA